MTMKSAALLAAIIGFSGAALAANLPSATPDPNAVSSNQQTVYRGQGADSLLTLLQTVGMNPELTTHKATDGTLVGPFITEGGVIGWSYTSNAPTSSGNSYPVPPANFLSGTPATSTARFQFNLAMETLSFSMVVNSKTLYVALFQYHFNAQAKQWEWQLLSYTETPLQPPPTK